MRDIFGEPWRGAATSGARRALLPIVLAAVILRLGSAIVQGDHVVPLPGIYDQVSYHALAIRVLGGHGFSFPTPWWPYTRPNQPTAQWSFLYTLYLSAIYLLTGLHPVAARVIQALIAGIAQPLLSYRIGRRLFNEPIGLTAAALSAVYLYFVYYAGALMTETFYILAVLAAIDLALTFISSLSSAPGSARITNGQWIRLGLALGVAALLRQLILLFVPLIFLVLIIARHGGSIRGDVRSLVRDSRSLVGGLLVSGATIAALILPWTIRNFRAFHQFVLLNTNDGFVFFWANNPVYGTHYVPLLPNDAYARMIPESLRGLNEASLNSALLARGIGFVLADPLRFVLLSFSRIPYYFQFWPSGDSSLTSDLARFFSFGILLPFMVVGIFLAVRDNRGSRSDRRLMVGFLALFVAVYSLIHLMSWTLIRYRLPVDAVLIVFAARAVDGLARRVVDQRSGGLRSVAGFGRAPSEIALPSETARLVQTGRANAGEVQESIDRGER